MLIQGIQDREAKTLLNLFFSRMLVNISAELLEFCVSREETACCWELEVVVDNLLLKFQHLSPTKLSQVLS